MLQAELLVLLHLLWLLFTL